MPPIEGDGDPPGGGAEEARLALADTYRRHFDLLRDIAQKKFHVPACDAVAIVNDIFLSMLARRPCQHLRVELAWRNDSDPHDIVPSCRQGGNRRGRKILVGEKTQNQAALGNTFSELSVSRA